MKKAAILIVLALAAGALVACGSDDDENGDTSPAATATTETAETTDGAAGGEDATGAGDETIEFEAASEGLAYTEDEVSADAGKATIEFTNPQAVPHDVAIEDAAGTTIAQTDVVTDSSADPVAVNLKPAEYTFYCTVPGHREGGMEGTLNVE